MTKRRDRRDTLLRQILGELVLTKLSDPRIDQARTTITRVELAEDFLTAKVYVSVLGDEADQRKTLRALKGAAGHLQELMMKQISLRHTPHLEFVFDEEFKKTLKTLQLIQQAMNEIHEKERAADGDETDETDETPPPAKTEASS
jgi:ribosome-binding factor A